MPAEEMRLGLPVVSPVRCDQDRRQGHPRRFLNESSLLRALYGERVLGSCEVQWRPTQAASAEPPLSCKNSRAAFAPSTSKRFSPLYRSVKPRSCRIAATAKSSASGAIAALSARTIPNNQERIT